MGLEVSAVNAVPVSKLCVICWFFLRPRGPFNRSNHRITGRAGAQWGDAATDSIAFAAVGRAARTTPHSRGGAAGSSQPRCGALMANDRPGATRELCRAAIPPLQRTTARSLRPPDARPVPPAVPAHRLFGRAAWPERRGSYEAMPAVRAGTNGAGRRDAAWNPAQKPAAGRGDGVSLGETCASLRPKAVSALQVRGVARVTPHHLRPQQTLTRMPATTPAPRRRPDRCRSPCG